MTVKAMKTRVNPEDMVKGHAALAKLLHVNRSTVLKWFQRGYLDKAVLVQVGKVILYDFQKAVECLHPSEIAKRHTRADAAHNRGIWKQRL